MQNQHFTEVPKYLSLKLFSQALIYFFVMPFLLFSCGQTTKLAEQEAERSQHIEQPVDPTTRIQAEALFIRGIAAFESGEYDNSIAILLKVHEMMPDNAAVHYALMDAYLNIGEASNAIYYGERAVERSKTNKWYQMKLAESYRMAGRFGDSIKQLHKILEFNPNDLEVLYQIAGLESRRGMYRESNDAYNRILNFVGPDRNIYFQKFQNYSALSEQQSALRQLELISELDPSNISILQTLSQFYLDSGEPQKAIDLLNDALEKEPGNTEIQIIIADVYISQGDWEKGGNILNSIILDEEVGFNSKMEILQYVASQQTNNLDDPRLEELVASMIAHMISTHSENGVLHAVLADYYGIIGDTGKALHHLEKTTALIPEIEAAWRQRLQFIYENGDYEAVIQIGKQANDAIPDDAIIQFFIGGAYLVLEKYQDAIRWLKQASQLPSRRPFRSIITGTLGDAYAGINDWDNADQAYEEAIRYDPENDVALNNYAYYLSTRNKDLERAKEMALRALDTRPDNAAYLDTMGWIYFKLGDYEQAHKYISASVGTGSASATVLEHMGDVYEKLGKMDKAVEFWGRAFEKDNSRIYLKEKLPGM